MVDEDESVDLSFGLEGKVTVVTGGAAGIGAAIARAFVAKGARVALVDRDIDTARAHARNLGENARASQCDVADPSSAENRSWAERAYPQLIYYNQAGKGGHFAAWEQPQLFSEEVRAAFRSLR